MTAFYVEGFPRPKGSKTAGQTKDGRMFVRDSAPKGLTVWRKLVREQAKAAAPAVPWDGPVRVTLTFHFDRPASHPKARTTWPIGHQLGDVDKLARAVLDELTGRQIADDALITDLRVRKAWASDEPGRRAGVHVWVGRPADYTALTSPS